MSTSGQTSLQQPLFTFYLLLNNIPKVIAWSVTQNYFLMIQQLTVLLGLSSLSSLAKHKQVLCQWIYDQVLAFLLCDSSATLWVILCSVATTSFLLEQWAPGKQAWVMGPCCFNGDDAWSRRVRKKQAYYASHSILMAKAGKKLSSSLDRISYLCDALGFGGPLSYMSIYVYLHICLHIFTCTYRQKRTALNSLI